MRAYLALGSNLGDRWAYLHLGAGMLARLDPQLTVSPVYETAPVGGPSGQGPYLNAVVRIDTERSARELLDFAHGIEAEANRVRVERWGARTLDVDIVAIEGERVGEPDLVIPHPQMSERAFVLAPLEAIAPAEVPGGWRQRLADQLDEVRKVGYLVSPFLDASARVASR